MVLHAPSRRTAAFSASRDFSAARVACARLSWNRPSAALNIRRAAMIAASTYLPSTSSSTIAASSIHGTGAQNFSSAIRNGWMLVSGIAFAPNLSSRRRASLLVRPFCKLTLTAPIDSEGAAISADNWVLATMGKIRMQQRLPARHVRKAGRAVGGFAHLSAGLTFCQATASLWEAVWKETLALPQPVSPSVPTLNQMVPTVSWSRSSHCPDSPARS